MQNVNKQVGLLKTIGFAKHLRMKSSAIVQLNDVERRLQVNVIKFKEK